MLSILLVTFGAVFAAEIAGDKLLYTAGVLAARYRTAPIVFGMGAAFMAKMGVAVFIGKAISSLPPWIVAAVTALNFTAVAFVVWRKGGRTESDRKPPASRAALVSFAAIFFSEWGDAGQVTAATLAARFGAPLAVWTGAVSAMVAKGALAATVGSRALDWIRQRLSPQLIRCAAAGLLLLLGALSVTETLTGGHVLAARPPK